MKIDITPGSTFERLTVLSLEGRNRDRQLLWRCRCQCGSELIARASSLRTGKTKSCGCYRNDILAHFRRLPKKVTHGCSRKASPHYSEYKIWSSMKRRCKTHGRYAGRGISVCQRWEHSFEAFLSDMGPRPSPGHTVERIDNDEGYSPQNCRWATWAEQAKNRENTLWLHAFGKRQTLKEWADEFGLNSGTLWCRLEAGLPVSAALTEPIRRKGNAWKR